MFSGGVSLGALQVGALRALHQAGVYPDLCFGTSAGALNAARVGLGFTEEDVEALARAWSETRTRDVFGGQLVFSAVKAALRGSGSLMSSEGVRRIIERWIPAEHAALKLPVTLLASDLRSGETVRLVRGDLHRSLLASTAIPAVFPPVRIGSRTLVDGAVTANVPLREAAESGARTLVVLDAGHPCALEEVPTGFVAQISLVLTHALREQTRSELLLLPDDRVVLYLPAPCPLRIPPHDFDHGADLIEAGYAVVRPWLDRLVLAGPGIYGGPHYHG